MRTAISKVRVAFVALAALSLVVASLGAAHAKASKLLAKYRGQLILAAESFQVSDDDDAMLTQVKGKAKTELAGKDGGGDEGMVWDFAFLGVLKAKPGATKATLAFIDAKSGTQATYKELSCAADQEIIAADLTISENDGLTKGKTYDIVLTVSKGGKDVVLAKGKATFK